MASTVPIYKSLLNEQSFLSQHRVTLSADGQFVAYVVRTEPSEGFVGRQLRITNLDSKKTYIPEDDHSSWGPSWSPDGKRLAFYTQMGEKVYLCIWNYFNYDLKIHKSVQVQPMQLGGYPQWLGNNKVIIRHTTNSSVEVNKTNEIEKEEPTNTGVIWTTHASESDNRLSQSTTNNPEPQSSYFSIVDITSGTATPIITPFVPLRIFPAPNGERLAYVVWRQGKNTATYGWEEDHYISDADGSSLSKIVSGLRVSGAGRHIPCWSPNSQELAYVGNDSISIYSLTTGETTTILTNENVVFDPHFLLWCPKGEKLVTRLNWQPSLIDRSGNTFQLNQNLEGKDTLGIMKRIGETWYWSPDGNKLLFWTRDQETKSHGFYEVNVDDNSSCCVLEESKRISSAPYREIAGDFSDVSIVGNRIVYVSEAVDTPPDVWSLDWQTGETEQITELNPGMGFFGADEKMITWKNDHNQVRRGILLLPKKPKGENIPLVVNIYPKINPDTHLYRWNDRVLSPVVHPMALLNEGYAIFTPELIMNDEGEFIDEITNEFDSSVKAVHDLNIPFLSKKVGIIGHSYGGYSVNCIITRSAYIHAAVSASGFASLTSIWAKSFDTEFFNPYGSQLIETNPFGPNLGCTPWECPDRYVHNSPVTWLPQVEAPLLLIGGSEDQGYMPEEMLLGLERLEKNVSCVNYLGEGHFINSWKKENQEDVTLRVLEWFNKYLF